MKQKHSLVREIFIEQISVINPRQRNEKVFSEIVNSIARVGLKRPITVTEKQTSDGVRYDLVCGEGRLKAFVSLGETKIPAIIVDATSEECLISSLVENCARRQHTNIELLTDVGRMDQLGYSAKKIARLTGLHARHVYGVVRLLRKGEERILSAVEAGKIPLSAALKLVETKDPKVQEFLQDAYEAGEIRGRQLIVIKKLIEQRRRLGKRNSGGSSGQARRLTAAQLLKEFHKDADRKREIISKANQARDRLLLIVEAMRRLLGDAEFVELLETEGLDTMPAKIATRVTEGVGRDS